MYDSFQFVSYGSERQNRFRREPDYFSAKAQNGVHAATTFAP